MTLTKEMASSQAVALLLFVGTVLTHCTLSRKNGGVVNKRDVGTAGNNTKQQRGGGRVESLVNQFDPEIPIARAVTPPSSWYIDPEFYDNEINAVFEKNWHPVGRVVQFEKIGSYLAGEIFGIQYAVVRDKHGILHSFYNTCRHHAAKILGTAANRLAPESTGCVRDLVCPYHGWHYGLDGKLLNAPKSDGCEMNKEENSLIKIKVEEWGPFVFINFDPDAETLTGRWPEVHSRLQASGVDKLLFHSSRSYIVNCNWKVYVDNYLDGGYHVPVLHKVGFAAV